MAVIIIKIDDDGDLIDVQRQENQTMLADGKQTFFQVKKFVDVLKYGADAVKYGGLDQAYYTFKLENTKKITQEQRLQFSRILAGFEIGDSFQEQQGGLAATSAALVDGGMASRKPITRFVDP